MELGCSRVVNAGWHIAAPTKLCLLLLHCPAFSLLQPCAVSVSNGDGSAPNAVPTPISLLTRRDGNVCDTQLSLRLRGHCPRVVRLGDFRICEILRIRAGATPTTNEVRNGKLERMMPSEDSVVYQWRYINDVGLMRMIAFEMIPAARTSVPSRIRSASRRRRGVEMKGIGTIMVKIVLKIVGPSATTV